MVQLRIAVRYLFARKSHRAVNIISRISVAGVAVATAAIICVLSVFNGFSEISRERLSKLEADLRIEPLKGKTIPSADSIAAEISQINGTKQILPVIEERVLAIYSGRQLPVHIKGVAEGYAEMAGISDIIIDGEYSEHPGEEYNKATLSVGTAINLGARPGSVEPIILYAPKRVGKINPASPASAFRTDTLEIGCVFETGQSEYDTNRILIPLEDARAILDYDTEATAIEISLDPAVNSNDIRNAISNIIGDSYKILDRTMQQEQSYKMISMEKWITFAMLAFVLVIASFNVISTLSMLIIEKRDNITTLRSLGADNAQIGGIFAWEGWLISLMGGIGGTILGLILCYAQQWGEFIKLNGDPSQLSITVYPVLVKWSDVGIVFALVCVVGLLIAAISSAFAKKIR